MENSKVLVLPYNKINFYIYTSTFLGSLISQMFFVGGNLTIFMLKISLIVSSIFWFIFFSFCLWLTYRATNKKSIEPFFFISVDKNSKQNKND